MGTDAVEYGQTGPGRLDGNGRAGRRKSAGKAARRRDKDCQVKRLQSVFGATALAARPGALAFALLTLPVPALAAADGMAETADPAAAEEAPPSDQQIAEGLFSATSRLRAPRRQAVCGVPDKNGDIIVCGANRGEEWRVPSTTTSDPASRQAQQTGVPQAPNVSSLSDCSRGCIGIGKAREQMYVVDLAQLPKPPAGSDADLIAKGEMPAP